MKTLSLKLNDEIFNDAEEMTSKLKLARSRTRVKCQDYKKVWCKAVQEITKN